ncbi:hypothetical protein FQR65_LT20436 [Abscondita terminalis]|nr:hypothetical protein FQR65_LT20436 [Abscondita terminalis]
MQAQLSQAVETWCAAHTGDACAFERKNRTVLRDAVVQALQQEVEGPVSRTWVVHCVCAWMIELKGITQVLFGAERAGARLLHRIWAIGGARLFGHHWPHGGAGKELVVRNTICSIAQAGGQVIVGRADLTPLPAVPACASVGAISRMVFHLNLAASRNGVRQCCLALEFGRHAAGGDSAAGGAAVDLVGLAGLARALSGAVVWRPEQRVGIARALANRPRCC